MIVAHGYGLSTSGGGSGAGDIFIYGELSIHVDSGDYVIKTASECRVQLDGELTVRLDDEAF